MQENEKICRREMRKRENTLESVNLGSCRGSGDRFQSSHDRLEDTIAHQGVADDIGKQFKERYWQTVQRKRHQVLSSV